MTIQDVWLGLFVPVLEAGGAKDGEEGLVVPQLDQRVISNDAGIVMVFDHQALRRVEAGERDVPPMKIVVRLIFAGVDGQKGC